MTGAQFKARVYQILGIPSTLPEVPTDVIADNFLARVDELTLLIKPPTMRTQTTRAVVANSPTIYLPSDFLQAIKLRLADANGNYRDLSPQTQEDMDGQDSAWQDSSQSSDVAASYSYAGIVTSTGSASYGQRVVRLSPTPTTSDSDGLLVRYWKRGTDLITGTSSQYQIVEVPRAYQLGLAHGVCGLIATDPRLNRDPVPHLQVWQDMVARYQHFGSEYREYDYQATGYSSVAVSQRSHWENY